MGSDRFIYLNPNEGGDVTEDFEVGTDKILIVSAVFDRELSSGILAAGSFVIGAVATDTEQRFIYNDITGDLFFDLDGNGAQTQQLITSIDAATGLNFSDIQVL